MFDKFMTKLARRMGENVGKSKVGLVRAQIEAEFGLEEDDEGSSKSRKEKREKLEKMARAMDIENIKDKSDNDLMDEIADKLSE